ncbi:IS66 family transposase [Virgibacillus pantothenticus]|uniref:IS66 family transposase n=1 Tax=Virgibacillus pantothenticus TaxID=1473 RepID=UPI0020B3946C|nr:IS66 family transposase [Virgibacillus pantothenticus]MEB5452732.1 IS66 family transposase [Virgibacillus pantothenticus]MEB5456831.1 IS66 family transposase [Virgibacillus pantothenticus]MEB5460986.1 IS66 family transposase [Virgibacillus pantothenticus]MEB5465225.1 IS66 family transposase [Virgibacillus pantothenticus]MEB5469632.1 IS66 family transposase [Virgibacillus pantothenticus]
MVPSSPDQNNKLIKLLEEQLAQTNEQNKALTKQVEALTEQVRHLTKLLYGSKTEQSKYNLPDGQTSLFDEDDDDSFSCSEHTEEQSQQMMTYTVERKVKNRKRNDFLADNLEVEEIHHHPEDTTCDCCQQAMTEMGSTIVREEAMFIPATMKKIQHVEHAYECKNCKGNSFQNAQIKRGQAPVAPIQRSLTSPSVLAKVIYDKFIQYLPLYRQVKEWERCGLHTNDKNLSNWVIRAAQDWLLPVYERMKEIMMKKSVLHVDETFGKIIHRSDGKPGNSNAYNWVYRSVPSQGPIIVLFQSALSRARSVLQGFVENFTGTIISDGYSAYDKIPGVSFANCWAHVRRYWLKVNSKNGKIGVGFCDKLYQLEREFKGLSPSKRRKNRQKRSKPIVEEFLKWVEESPFYGNNALGKAAEYTLNLADGLQAFLNDGRIEMDNNQAENAIRPSVIGRNYVPNLVMCSNLSKNIIQ